MTQYSYQNIINGNMMLIIVLNVMDDKDSDEGR